MNIYKTKHNTEYKADGMDGIAETIHAETKHFSSYEAAVAYAQKYGCVRSYGDIDDGPVNFVGKWTDDPYYGRNQTQITITRIEVI